MATTEVPTQEHRQITPMQNLRASLLRAVETQKERIAGIIDKRSVLIACEQIEANPKLLECSPASIFRGILKAGFYNWVCDGILGQGYLVPFKGQATLIAGYKGLRDLVRRSGQADTVMECVHQGDTFTFNGIFAEPMHIKGSGDRTAKPVLGAYVIVFYFTSKSCKTFWWPIEQILAHRDRYSIGWKKKGGPNAFDHPWHEKNGAFPVMCMKTVLRSVINRGEAPVSLGDRSVARAPDEDDGMIDAESGPTQIPAVPSGLLSEEPMVSEPEAAGEGTGNTPKTKATPPASKPADPPPKSTPASDLLADEDAQREAEMRAQEYHDAIDGLDDPAAIGDKVAEALRDAKLKGFDALLKAVNDHGEKRAARGTRTNKGGKPKGLIPEDAP